MRTFTNNFGDKVTDEKNYYVVCSNDEFFTETEPEEFYTNWNKARSYAIKQSHIYATVEIRCERWIDDPDYDAPVTIWSEGYENGKKQYRNIWRV